MSSIRCSLSPGGLVTALALASTLLMSFALPVESQAAAAQLCSAPDAYCLATWLTGFTCGRGSMSALFCKPGVQGGTVVMH